MSLHLDQFRISLAGQTLVSLDLSIAPGQIVTLMGPSGCGKSTALLGIAGALPTGFTMTGQVWLEGRAITLLRTEARQIGILFQDPLLFPHLSVAGNLAFGLPRALPDRRARIEAALQDCGLPGYGSRDPATLSGGQAARIALMRTLLAQPRALLLDEPFAKLDAGLREQMRAFTFDRARMQGLPVLLVTHDPADAQAAGGPVVDVTGRPLA